LFTFVIKFIRYMIKQSKLPDDDSSDEGDKNIEGDITFIRNPWVEMVQQKAFVSTGCETRREQKNKSREQKDKSSDGKKTEKENLVTSKKETPSRKINKRKGSAFITFPLFSGKRMVNK